MTMRFARLAGPALQLQQFDLQQMQIALIVFSGQPLLIWVAATRHGLSLYLGGQEWFVDLKAFEIDRTLSWNLSCWSLR